MARLEPRPPAEVRSPLSPATLEVLRRLGGGRGGLLFLTGDDRVARTQLLRAVAAHAATSKVDTVQLRAHPLDQETPFGALSPWFSSWFHQAREDAAPKRGGLDASFFTALAGLIGPATSSDPAAGEDPERSDRGREAATNAGPRSLGPEEIRAELLGLVEGRSHTTPAVVTVQDAEFLDPASRDWLLFLGSRLPGLPLVLVLSLDPSSPGFDRWKSGFAQVTTTWERWPAETKSRHPEPALGERLKSLSSDARELVATATLAGPDAQLRLLRRVLGWEEERLTSASEKAVEAGFLERLEDGLSLLEPALYPNQEGTLAPARILALRRSIASALEKDPGAQRGPRLFRLSEQWASAGDVARGFETLTAAAREADRWGSPEMAEARMLRALALVQTDPTTYGREMEEKGYAQLAGSRLRASDPAGAAEAFRRALTLAQEQGKRPLDRARYVSGLATAQTRLGQDPEALLQETLASVAGQSNDLEATLLSTLGFFYRERGRTALAAEVTERACGLADRGSDPSLKALVHLDVAEALFFGGGSPELERARAHLKTALTYREAVERSSDPSLSPMVLDALSHVELASGNPKEAVRWGDEALVAARRVGSRSCLLQALGNQAEVHLEVDDLVRARELTQELRRQCDRFGLTDMDVDRQQLFLLEGLIASARGGYEHAREQFEHLVAAAEKAGTRYYLAQALAHLVVLSVQKGDLEGARGQLRRLERAGGRKTLPGVVLKHLEAAESKLGTPEGGAAHPG